MVQYLYTCYYCFGSYNSLWNSKHTFIFVYAYNSTRRMNPTDDVVELRRNIPLTNRDARALKHAVHVLCIYNWLGPYIYICIVTKPRWYNSLIRNFMQLIPELSMLIAILDLFIIINYKSISWKEL